MCLTASDSDSPMGIAHWSLSQKGYKMPSVFKFVPQKNGLLRVGLTLYEMD